MGLVESVFEYFRPEMPVSKRLAKEQEERAKSRLIESLYLDYVFLSERGLGELREENKRYFNCKPEFLLAEYASAEGEKGRSRKVVVSVYKTGNLNKVIEEAERELKLGLECRGCNAGVFYRTHEKGGRIYAEAVPAILKDVNTYLKK